MRFQLAQALDELGILTAKRGHLGCLAGDRSGVADAADELQLVRLERGAVLVAPVEGKTIGVNGLDGIPHLAVREWIDRNGGDSTKTHFVQMTFTEMTAAVGAGRVDAASFDVTADPTLGNAGDAFRLIAPCFSAVSPKFLPAVWFAKNDWIAAHPLEAKAFIGVMRHAATWANGNRGESASIVAKYSNIPVALLQSVARVTYGTELDPPMLQPNIDLAVRYGAIASRFDARELISKVATS